MVNWHIDLIGSQRRISFIIIFVLYLHSVHSDFVVPSQSAIAICKFILYTNSWDVVHFLYKTWVYFFIKKTLLTKRWPRFICCSFFPCIFFPLHFLSRASAKYSQCNVLNVLTSVLYPYSQCWTGLYALTLSNHTRHSIASFILSTSPLHSEQFYNIRVSWIYNSLGNNCCSTLRMFDHAAINV